MEVLDSLKGVQPVYSFDDMNLGEFYIIRTRDFIVYGVLKERHALDPIVGLCHRLVRKNGGVTIISIEGFYKSRVYKCPLH